MNSKVFALTGATLLILVGFAAVAAVVAGEIPSSPETSLPSEAPIPALTVFQNSSATRTS